MVNNSSLTKFYRETVEKVEEIYQIITELFGEESSEDGLFSQRSNVLQQFAVLASAYHQLNTLDYLENTEEISNTFTGELNTANYRTRDYEHRAIKSIKKNTKSMKKHLETIINLIEDVRVFETHLDDKLEMIENTYYENIIQSVSFYLQEISTRILQPAGKILDTEISAAIKLIKLITTQDRDFSENHTEAIARMCEVLSWGLETPPGWNAIQNDTSELTGDLEKKIVNLKAITTYYRS